MSLDSLDTAVAALNVDMRWVKEDIAEMRADVKEIRRALDSERLKIAKIGASIGAGSSALVGLALYVAQKILN